MSGGGPILRTDAPTGVPGTDDYQAFAERLRGTGLVTDPWVEGAPRFRARPLHLMQVERHALERAAESVAAVHHELCCLVQRQPWLLDEFFGLTPVQKLLFQTAAPLWHGLARADTFFVADDANGVPSPPMVCEINCDTPSGLAETAVLRTLSPCAAEVDPNLELEARFARLLATFIGAVDRPPGASTPTVGIVYPTELAGDFGLIRLYESWCQRAGFDTVLGSPFNLQPGPRGTVAMFGRRCDLLLRHYKTDWWGERLPIWADEAPYPDPEPLARPLAVVLRALARRRCAVINPFGAVLPQNKRSYAFMWEEQSRFSPGSQAVIRAHVPQTIRLERADRDQLLAEQSRWVLKSDYGCEGEEVILGAECTSDEWRASLEQALPHRWVAQRHFLAARDAEGLSANHGIFLIGGKAAGLYTRLSAGATDAGALSVPVEIHG